MIEGQNRVGIVACSEMKALCLFKQSFASRCPERSDGMKAIRTVGEDYGRVKVM
ncbi:MAG: hypothetical protein NPIRA01_22300 [Nitrospirales bacterium]|nr:MAG: hypothetical protein NPIRA01_22300 [Nitrospirales bacterium]